MGALAAAFARQSIRHLGDEYLPRLRRALESLPEDDLWWRPHDNITSVGNLLVHLEGNVRMWILSGLGGVAFRRRRAEEFERRNGGTKEDLLASLEATVEEACATIGGLTDADLLGARTIQGFETAGLAAVYHVVEHFGWHAGQIVWIAKMRGGERHGIAFYDDASLNRRER